MGNVLWLVPLVTPRRAASWAGGSPTGPLHLEGPWAWLNSVLSTILALHFNFTRGPTSYVAGPGPVHLLTVGFVISSSCSSSQSPLPQPHPFMIFPSP